MATKKRMIYADDLVDELYHSDEILGNDQWETSEIVYEIGIIPTVDAVEVVHGRGKFLDIDGWWFDECSICGNTTPNRDGSPPDWNYCPNCGAKMDGGIGNG